MLYVITYTYVSMMKIMTAMGADYRSRQERPQCVTGRPVGSDSQVVYTSNVIIVPPPTRKCN